MDFWRPGRPHFWLLLGCILLIDTSKSPAHAYLDPGTGTMLLQGIVAGIAGGAAFITLKFNRAKELLGSLRRRIGGRAS